MLYYVIGLSVLLGWLTTVATDGQARALSYTEHKQLVRSGKVVSLGINQERVRGNLILDGAPAGAHAAARCWSRDDC